MFKGALKPGLYPGEMAWEVMEQSESHGEVPVRLAVGPNAIRTVTSLILTKPVQILELWKVVSPNIVKVSWCPDLCALSILYVSQPPPLPPPLPSQSALPSRSASSATLSTTDSRRELVKVFLCDHFMGPRIIKSYKRIKPVTVHLSPNRAFSRRPDVMGTTFSLSTSAPAGPLLSSNRPTATIPPPTSLPPDDNYLSTSFVLSSSLKNERLWRAVFIPDDLLAEEVFIGVSPKTFRVIDPVTHEPQLVLDYLNILSLKHEPSVGSDLLRLKFTKENTKGKPKKKKMVFNIHPAVGKDLMRHYDFCNTIGEEADLLVEVPKFNLTKLSKEDTDDIVVLTDRPTGGVSNDADGIGRAQSEGHLKREKSRKKCTAQDERRPTTHRPTTNSTNPFATNRKELLSFTATDPFSENKENINPNKTNMKPLAKPKVQSFYSIGEPQLHDYQQGTSPLPPQTATRTKSVKGLIKI